MWICAPCTNVEEELMETIVDDQELTEEDFDIGTKFNVPTLPAEEAIPNAVIPDVFPGIGDDDVTTYHV